MKIYDCFTYCGEDLLLKIRLESLYNQVDRFIIIEGNKYFNGESKKKIFNISNFVKYEKKIEYYFVEDFPKHDGNNWNYEFYQRNQISRGLKDLNKDDYVLVSDVDEIPKLDKKLFLKHDSLVFMQKMFYYKFNIHYHEGLKWKNKWPGTKGCKYKFFKSAQKIRNYRNKNIPWWRFDRKIKRHVKWDGGWHFAYLMNNEDISNKLNRFDHEISHLLRNQNYNKMSLMDKKEINQRIKNLRDPYNRKDVKLKKVNIDKTYPKFIYENIDKLSEFID
tara:strand:+ start:1297 stop:2124 length:828 start_codon:yes stop_codon:yes gene_type:complete